MEVSEKLSVFPNPAIEYLNIDFITGINNFKQLNIFDVFGRHILTINENNLQTSNERLIINVEKLNSGIHFGKIISDQANNLSFTFIKK